MDENHCPCCAHAAREIAEYVRLKQLYYNEAQKGWTKFREAEREITDLRADFTTKCQENYGLRNEMASQAARIAGLEGGSLGEIAAERRRQIEVEGWTPEHDDAHTDRSLACAAACYAVRVRLYAEENYSGMGAQLNAEGLLPQRFRSIWPWSSGWWKPTEPRRDLIKAGALIVAELDRLARAALKEE